MNNAFYIAERFLTPTYSTPRKSRKSDVKRGLTFWTDKNFYRRHRNVSCIFPDSSDIDVSYEVTFDMFRPINKKYGKKRASKMCILSRKRPNFKNFCCNCSITVDFTVYFSNNDKYNKKYLEVVFSWHTFCFSALKLPKNILNESPMSRLPKNMCNILVWWLCINQCTMKYF